MSVACNVYVSAGRPHHADLLLRILHRAQGLCHNLRAVDHHEPIAVVHAFADGPYDRSSFHLAGGAENVVTVATELARGAIEGLLMAPGKQDEEDACYHPFVGLVDHVAVMPLGTDLRDGPWSHKSSSDLFAPTTPSGWAARTIGTAMEDIGAQLRYYGTAHPNGTPLATVRREQTEFFRSRDREDRTKESSSSSNRIGMATVGAPLTFVENYNVRLSARCNRNVARSLTRVLRERDGGLPGVEALTLPYSEGRYEVACNLLCPDVGSSGAIDTKVHEWDQRQLKMSPSHGAGRKEFVEKSYRVGTTAEQCLSVLSISKSMEEVSLHDEQVAERLQRFLSP